LLGAVFYFVVLSLLFCHRTLLLHDVPATSEVAHAESLLKQALYTSLIGMLKEEAGNGSFGQF